MFDFIKKLLSGSGEGEIKRLNVIVRKVEALEERYKAMSDDELRGQTALFKERVKKGESLDDLLPEAFAVVREGAWRSVGMRHFPVQILGGIVLHQGRIAEMKTGEG
ncbi:MAG TPA: preprotein translocase subunit SecA, partial [Candidatus Faecaligallichristensenella faecipullorum]|nr:preprotein translocase subunit SecA [Candidatus Faecaligallichristensenella faecipullorum]